jgi:hypothetical protein
MSRKLNWVGFSSGDRTRTIEEIKRTVIRSDGFIISFNMFSDLALSLIIEILEKRVRDLHAALQKILDLTDLDPSLFDPQSQKEWMILLNITFADGTGNLSHEIPAADG